MELDDLRGRIVDFDSHLMLFPDTLDEILGPAYANARIRRMVSGQGVDPATHARELAASRRRGRRDPWSVKGWGALGAQVAEERLEAMDKMGIRQQVLFSIGMMPALYAGDPDALTAIERYNDHVLEWTKATDGRVLPVCLLNTSDRVHAVAEARRAIDGGARFVQLPYAVPAGGLSPAAPEWDSLWALLAEAGVPAVFHGGSSQPELQFLHPGWVSVAGTLRPPASDPSAGDVHAYPFVWMTLHVPAELGLSFLVLGGVFERHPNLRFAVVEMGASWVAAWCERMDTIAQESCDYLSRSLPLRPSEYVKRQIRVTPFEFEPVGTWIERDGLEEVYVFSTDYPHIEGGVNPIERFYDSLSPLSDEVVEGFFVSNGRELLGQ